MRSTIKMRVRIVVTKQDLQTDKWKVIEMLAHQAQSNLS